MGVLYSSNNTVLAMCAEVIFQKNKIARRQEIVIFWIYDFKMAEATLGAVF